MKPRARPSAWKCKRGGRRTRTGTSLAADRSEPGSRLPPWQLNPPPADPRGGVSAELDPDDWFTLLIGPIESSPSNEELEQVWRVHRDTIMGDEPVGGRQSMPWGWWVFEQGEDPPGYGAERARLIELGVIVDEEEETP